MLADQFEAWVRGFGLSPQRRVNTTSKGRSFQVSLRSQGLGALFRWLGLQSGATARTKRVPERLFSETLRNRRAYVEGLWVTDGDTKTQGLHLMNWPLLHDVHLLYDTIGECGHLSAVYRDGSAQLTRRRVRGVAGSKHWDPRYGATYVRDVRLLDIVEETFTLVVDHHNHRFFSDGVLSKNTACDLFKIALLKVHQAITMHGWQADVQQILWMHDEIVFRVRRRLLLDVVPALQEAMTFEVRGWPVRLKVDVAVGWSWGHASTVGGLRKATPHELARLAVDAPLTCRVPLYDQVHVPGPPPAR